MIDIPVPVQLITVLRLSNEPLRKISTTRTYVSALFCQQFYFMQPIVVDSS
jgi:hypothetical protein